MFAVIEIGGKQFKVEKGTKIEINRLEEEENNTFDINNVLLISDDSDTKIGTPNVEGAYVVAKVLEHKRAEKIRVFKMKAKKRYMRTQGHRQDLTVLEITDVKASGGKKAVKAEKEVKTEEPKAEKPKTVKKAAVKKEPAKKTTAKKSA